MIQPKLSDKLGALLIVITFTTLLSPSAGSAITVERLLMPGAVILGHAEYEDDCAKCHIRFKKLSQRQLCLDCHKEVATDVKEKTGFHGLNSDVTNVECKHCHTEHKGRGADVVRLDKEVFDHAITDFPLKGGHVRQVCTACHLSKDKYRDAPSNCIDCHKDDDVHKGRLGESCNDCHTEKSWNDIETDHDKTDFPLEGKHRDVSCHNCHPDERYKKTPQNCYVCHAVDNVHESRYGKKCGTCHTSEDWKKSVYDHDETKFSLKGKHMEVDCDTCHTGKLYDDKLDTVCFACHENDDNHKKRYGKECDNCHTPDEWPKSIFDHDKDTKFPLKEKHKEVECDTCHKGEVYQEKLKEDCYSCHSLDDVHEGGLGETCDDCHNPTEWEKTTFDHDKDTEFPLLDKHIDVECHVCHTLEVYPDKIATACFGCHEQDDVHKGQEGKECNYCHNEKGWRVNVFFDHDLTHFPLIGLHAIVPCEECHLTTAYKDTSLDCVDCHKSDDLHKQRLGLKCDTCHNPNSWNLWRFDHDSQTEFILDGAHNGLVCESCHKKRVKKKMRISTACNSCHFRDDEHRGGFGKHCERCHITESFKELKIAQ